MNFSAPTVSALEELVRAVTSEALDLTHVAPSDNLLELGVDSLVAALIVARLRATFGLDVPLVEVFESADVHDFAERAMDLVLEGQD